MADRKSENVIAEQETCVMNYTKLGWDTTGQIEMERIWKIYVNNSKLGVMTLKDKQKDKKLNKNPLSHTGIWKKHRGDKGI